MDSKAPARGYHHGNLREALVDAGVQLARTGGPAAVQLRVASREAGVSHNAAYRHFANQEDLVAAVAVRCMHQLGLLMLERMQTVTARGPVRRAQARFEAVGRAYIDFARAEPGWFRTAFSSARPHSVSDPAKEAEPGEFISPYQLLSERLDELVEVGAITRARRRGAEYAAWSSVHGISSLMLDGPLRYLPEAEAQSAIGVVLTSVGRGLE